MLYLQTPVRAQGLDVYGGSTSLQCGPNTKAVTSDIVSVARNAGLVTLTFSANHRFIVNDVISVTGTTVDGGSFNTPAQTLFTITAVPSSTSVAYAQAGNNVPTTPDGGSTSAGRFYVSKVNSRWWICTPLGNVFWANEVFDVVRQDTVDYQSIDTRQLIASKYGQGLTVDPTLNWAVQIANRLKAWGFNALGEYSDGNAFPTSVDGNWPTPDHTIPAAQRVPYVVEPNPILYSTFNSQGYAPGPAKAVLGLYKRSVFNVIGVRNMADLFDPNFSAWLVGNLTGQTYTNTHFKAPHHEYIWAIVGDESDEGGGLLMGPDFSLETGGGSNDPGAVVLLKGYDGMDVHWGWFTLITSPVMAAISKGNTAGGDSPGDIVFADTKYYVKAELRTYLQRTADRGPGYSTIAALNAAWGSNYDSFGSDAVSHVDFCAMGNGTAGPYTCTLKNLPVTPLSVQVKSRNNLSQVLLAGDDGAGPELKTPTSVGNIRYTGGTAPIGAVNYATGSVTFTLSSAVASGTPLVVSYQTNGWGTGHGLLDEDGTCPSKASANFGCWIPALPFWKSTDVETQFQKDLDGFLFHWAKGYLSIVKGDIDAAFPGYLYIVMNPTGAYSDPPRREILEAISLYADILAFNSLPPVDPTGIIKDGQARMDFVARYAGDMPWINDNFLVAQADSYFSQFPTTALTFSTQSERGQYYQSETQAGLVATISSGCLCGFAGTNPIVGQGWWELYDDASTNVDFGLITDRDDPYDGVADTPNPGVDQWGYPTGCQGASALPGPTTPCEQGSYGDVLTAVKASNALWLQHAQ